MTFVKRSERLSGWGRTSPVSMQTWTPAGPGPLASEQLPSSDVATIARGLGRSYGDAAQCDGGLAIDTTGCVGASWVERERGVLRVSAGTTIGDLIDRFVPKGWFVPVTPGTRSVTIGGAVAADIHGKNHHLHGSIGNHVLRIELRTADDVVRVISPTDDPSLFWATVGGMGLTGVIISADIAMKPIPSALVAVETSRFGDLRSLTDAMAASDHEHDYSVAWVDLIGGQRSVLTQGSFAAADSIDATAAGAWTQPGSRKVSLPPLPPVRLVSRPALRLLNEAWFRRAPANPTVTNESITAFFHPLDMVANWNQVYGPTGFVQWQCVVPDLDPLFDICDRFAELPSFFSVLKRMGPESPAPLSFPLAGWTLTVDLPATTSVLAALHDFDGRVVAAGGRIYLAKDARMSRETFEASYPRLDEWKQVRHRIDPSRRWQSDLANRLGL